MGYIDQIRYFAYTRCTLFGVAAVILLISGFIDLAFQIWFIHTFVRVFRTLSGFNPVAPFWIDPLYSAIGVPTYSALVIVLSIVLIMKWTRLRKLTEGEWTHLYVGLIPYLGIGLIAFAIGLCSILGAVWLTLYPWANFTS